MNFSVRILCILAGAFCLNNGLTKSWAQSDSAAANTFHHQQSESQSENSNALRYRPAFVADLPKAILETSGLLYSDTSLWTINDSGNPPEVFRMDTSGRILRKIRIANARNTDWESITQDAENIYIGDFGNNYGNRINLHILKIAKSDLLNPAKDSIEARYINFTYPDQRDYTPALNRNNFDCEAFIFYNDSLHLFSKDWADEQSRHYVIPAQPGSYTAKFVEFFNVDGLITDASINRQGNIVLLGYKNRGGRFWDCFCWILKGYTDSHFLNGQKTRVELGSAFHIGQSEGIFLNDDNTAWLSSESIRKGLIRHSAKLFRLDLKKYY